MGGKPMHLRTDFELKLDLDKVLRGQGADPQMIRQRSPALVKVAERALREGLPLIEPVVVYRKLKVKSINHQRMALADGGSLSGKLIIQQLAPAREVVVMLCTIGRALEAYSAAVLRTDPSFGLALDGLGSAAIDSLVVEACTSIGEEAAVNGMQATIPLNPGMEGWDLEAGQSQVFKLIDPSQAGIQVTAGGMMFPQKSTSLVIGIGEDISAGGRPCDYCSMRNTCRYQDQYAR